MYESNRYRVTVASIDRSVDLSSRVTGLLAGGGEGGAGGVGDDSYSVVSVSSKDIGGGGVYSYWRCLIIPEETTGVGAWNCLPQRIFEKFVTIFQSGFVFTAFFFR